jgi:riboflavin kinase/FMN adenylyltransferase
VPTRAIAIGNFDGVHRGHQQVLRDAKDAVLTFDPHPAVALGRVAPSILTALPRKIELLERAGVGEVVVQRFDDAFAAWSPERFVTDLLVGQMSATVVVVGRNFRFGNKRAGDLATLERLGKEHGFAVRPFDLCGDELGPFSSTRVRDALGRGDVDDAARVLGRPHAFAGTVGKGDQRGRTIGFPTANIEDVVELVPAAGVYAVVVDRIDHFTKTAGRGVMNVGVRPTVKDAGRRTQEVHLFDFDEDLYGAKLRVHVVSRIREERKFATIDELRAQIAADAQAARAITSKIEPNMSGAFG